MGNAQVKRGIVEYSDPKCRECPRGNYCPPGSTTPEPCDAGTYGNSTGFRSSFECIKCDPGTFCPDRGMEVTGLDCSAGYYCKSGSKSKNPRDGITGDICPKGAYCEAGVSAPSPCTSGKTTLFEGATAETDCKPCYPGFYCPNDSDASDMVAKIPLFILHISHFWTKNPSPFS